MNMDKRLITKRIRVGGMTCINCETKIERRLRKTVGVEKANASYNEGIAVVTYHSDIVSLEKITALIEKLDYQVLSEDFREKPNMHRMISVLAVIVAIYVILEHFKLLNLLVPSQLANEAMGYGMLFIIGLATSVHCIAMCGGINLSQCLPQGSDKKGGRLSAFLPPLLYNAGRVFSYTAVGFTVGALGSTITFTNTIQAALKFVAGVFMVIMGINLLGFFPWLRKWNPRMPKFIAQRINSEKSQSKAPLIVGLFNGFMPCGPLQAMQIYALSTGNPFAGALSMFLFSIGTVPLMFGLGAFSSWMGKRFMDKALSVGAVLVVVLGLSMFSQGLGLSGFGQSPADSISGYTGEIQSEPVIMENEVQVVNSTLTSRSYPAITVQAGLPVKWVIDAPQGSINGCNNRLFIREYGIEHTFTLGENIIEFTPENEGTFSYACWMGMIRSTITVVNDKPAL
ncbi:MAG: sulfite exporter TauE/SafE family protein [Clostridiales bacterium]|nr:sulfite exporter TauE/SafE family protein [Clostridiales bacterium]